MLVERIAVIVREEQRVTIRLSLHGFERALLASLGGHELANDGLPEISLYVSCEDTRIEIVRAAGRIGRDQRDRPLGILGERRAADEQHHEHTARYRCASHPKKRRDVHHHA